MSSAETLKAEANALFAKKDYNAAIAIYTKAIGLDDPDAKLNAILFANRSFCHRMLSSFNEAISDGMRAIELDPTYVKGYGRVAAGHSAVDQHTPSARYYRLGLDHLPPKSKRTRMEETLFEEYTAALAREVETLNAPPVVLNQHNHATVFQTSATDRVPWVVAREMYPELERTGNADSSAWALFQADEAFKRAQVDMEGLWKQNGREMKIGKHGVISELTDALLMDERVFRIDRNHWLDMVQLQQGFEINQSPPWPTSWGASRIIEEAPKRVAREGWTPVRKAFALSIRLFIIRGFIQGKVGMRHEGQYDDFKTAHTLLQWGATTWADVPSDDRGNIFAPTFRNGVWKIYLNSIISVCLAHPERKREMLALLEKEATGLLNTWDKAIPAREHVVHVWAWFKNPAGIAHSALGFYHVQMCGYTNKGRNMHLRLASEHYLKAAGFLASDDEYHCWFLHCALQYMRETPDAPVKPQLDIIQRLKKTIPGMQKLWNASTARRDSEKDAAYKSDLALEDELKKRA